MGHQRNVQQQTEIVIAAMLRTARQARENGLPAGAEHFLLAPGIDPRNCALVFLESHGFMLGLDYGFEAFIVTPKHEIFDVELELTASQELLQVISFDDVTHKQNFSKQNRGTGWGWGAMALEVLRQMNAT